MARNEMLKIKQIEGLADILTGTAVSGPPDEIIIGAGLAQPLTSTINFRYNITDGLYVGAGGFRVVDFGGSGNQMVVVDDDGNFSVQDIPATAALTHTYVGVGGSDGIMTGTQDLSFIAATVGEGPHELRIRTGIASGSGDVGIVSIYADGNNHSEFSRMFLSGNYDGTSIGRYHSTSLNATQSGNFGAGPMVVSGTPIYNITGVTSTNYGTRLDSVGLRIGEISTLHTDNVVPFQVTDGDGTLSYYTARIDLEYNANTLSMYSNGSEGFITNPSLNLNGTTGVNVYGGSRAVFGTNSIWSMRLDAAGLLIDPTGATNMFTGSNTVPFQIANSFYANGSMMSIGAALSGGYNGSYGTYNSRLAGGAVDRHFVGESALNSAGAMAALELRNYIDVTSRFLNYAGVSGATLSGTSIDVSRLLRIDNTVGAYSSSLTATGPIALTGSIVYGISGSTATNFGFRHDAVGFRIGQLSTLHTANTHAFQVEGVLIYQSGASHVVSSSSGLDFSAAANDLTLNAPGGSIFNFRPTRFGSVVNPTARIDIQENTSSLASLRIRPSSAVAVSSPNTGDIWNDGTYINFGGSEGVAIGNGAALTATYGLYINSNSSTGIYVAQTSSSANPVTSFFKAINAGGTMEIVSRFNRGDGTTITPAAGAGSAISFGIPDGVSVYSNVNDAVVIGGIYDQVATTSSSSRNTAFKVRTMSAGTLTDRMQVGDLGTQINNLAGTGDRMVQSDEDGFVTASAEIVDGWLSDATVIALITDEDNWDILGTYTGTALTGTYQGQEHFDDKYYFKFVSDNNPIRMARV